MRFNSAYYLEKKEISYSDFQVLLILEEKNGMKKSGCYCSEKAAADFVAFVGKVMKEDLVKELPKARYYAILTDGSTDASILEQEVLYVYFYHRVESLF